MDLSDILSLSVAAVSLLLSIFVLWRQRQAAGRAHFTAEWESPETIVYVNHGPGAARDVRASMDSKLNEIRKTTEYIGAFQMMRINRVTRAFGESVEWMLAIEWKDNRWRRQSMVIPLSDPPPSPRSRDTGDVMEQVVRAIAAEEAERWGQVQAKIIRRGR